MIIVQTNLFHGMYKEKLWEISRGKGTKDDNALIRPKEGESGLLARDL
jgi:hypothetical protein